LDHASSLSACDAVASYLALCIFRLGLVCVSGLPRTTHPCAAPATKFRVAPNLQSIGCAGHGVSSCLEPHIFPRRRAFWNSESPRLSKPPATPLIRVSGCPLPRISGFAGDGVSSRLDARILRRCRLADLQVAPGPGLSVSPTIRSPGCPASWIFRHRLMDPRVTSDRAPSGCAIVEPSSCPEASSLAAASDPISRLPSISNPSTLLCDQSSGLPRRFSLSAVRLCSPGLPRFRIDGWVDDESPAVLELCILGEAADESSCPTGPAFPA
jgi:hypothetical protein